MAARAMWKGVVQVGDFRVPVKLYAAVEDRTIRFHLLHDQDLVRVRQRMVNPNTDKTVVRDQMRKGYDLGGDELVQIDDAELQPLTPAPSREIEIVAFVPPEQLNHQWYERPYWLGPDEHVEAYFALAEALREQGVEGVARWTMRGKRYLGALRAEQGYLGLVTLRTADEIVPAHELTPPQGRALDEKELQLAGQLVAALASHFDPEQFRDEYRDRVRELIEAKRKGEEVKVEAYEAPEMSDSLADSLAASLQALK